MGSARRAFEWFQNTPAGGGRKPVVRPYDYGFVGEMSVLMNAHPLIGPALAELFMQSCSRRARLPGPSARWSRRSPPRPRIATTERSPTQSFCMPKAGTAN